MIIVPTSIQQAGPGIDLSNQPEGLSLQMSDPVQDLAAEVWSLESAVWRRDPEVRSLESVVWRRERRETMIIPPNAIDQSGPGVDVSNQPEGVSIKISDPVRDLEYARNALTLTFDLSGYEDVRLGFEAMEFGDEPHSAPAGLAGPSGPFGADVDFDGVAISMDGVDWYEIQDLRSLRSDKSTGHECESGVRIL